MPVVPFTQLPEYMLPLTPAPPTTTKAPVVLLVAAVELLATILPFDVIVLVVVNVVNAPVLAVLAPITPVWYPVICPPLTVVTDVNVPAAALALPMIPLIPPPTFKLPLMPAPPSNLSTPVTVFPDAVVLANQISPDLKVPKLVPVNTFATSEPLSNHVKYPVLLTRPKKAAESNVS